MNAPKPRGKRSISAVVGSPPTLQLRTGTGHALFLVARSSIAFGRDFPSEENGVENDLVFRILPCRTRDADPKNFELSQMISGTHGRFLIEPEAVYVVDLSTHGTILEHRRLVKAGPEIMPDRYRLLIGQVLRLNGQVERDPETDRVASTWLVRRRNAEGHSYVLVREYATIGPSDEHPIPLHTHYAGIIYPKDSAWYVKAESEGLYLDGKPLKEFEPYLLEPGAVLMGPDAIPWRVSVATPEDFVRV